MNNPLLTLPLCMSNPFSWNLCLTYNVGFHKLSGCKLVLRIALAMSDSLLAVDNVSGWGHTRPSCVPTCTQTVPCLQTLCVPARLRFVRKTLVCET